MKNLQKYLSTCLLATAALLGGASPAFAAAPSAPSLGAASDFAVLSAGTATPPSTTTDATAAVSTTRSNITGNVGSAGAVSFGDASSPSVITGNVILSGAYTQVPAAPPNAFSGSLITPLPVGVITDFNAAYDALAGQSCDQFLTGTLADVTLTPGVYCFAAAAALTGTLTLLGGPNDTWLFKIGTSGTGALTGTNFSMVLNDTASACNVTWWVAQAATMTDSDFKGTILAGAAITATGTAGSPPTPFVGRALAKAAVTLTDVAFVGCTSGSLGGTAHPKCNQGVGNGPEGCDPGNSNQSNRYLANPFLRSNDEPTSTTPGGVPGDPGRKGGNN
jgi:hypothetical protein